MTAGVGDSMSTADGERNTEGVFMQAGHDTVLQGTIKVNGGIGFWRRWKQGFLFLEKYHQS